MTTESSKQPGPLVEANHEGTFKQLVARPNPDHDYVYYHQKAMQVMRKVDMRLLPILGVLYAIALVDRVNIANAYVAGMGKDLALTIGNRYTLVLVMFFLPCFLFELPSNLLLRRFGPAHWLASIGFAWGTVMLAQGFVNNYKALAACRALTGFFESGFFPGCVFLISCWYERYEVQKRLAAFYLFSLMFSGFSHILAYGLMHMEGAGGLRGWRWIFIIEGLLTQIIAVAAGFLIIDFPDKATRPTIIDKSGFLTPYEVDLVQHRIQQDRRDCLRDRLTWPKVGDTLCDIKMWAFAFFYMANTMPAYAFAYFTPVIVNDMGYSPGISNLLSAPPVIVAIPSALLVSYLSDRYQLRAPFIFIQTCFCILGLMLAAYMKHNNLRYMGIILGVMGCQGNIPAVLAYQSNNIRLQSKRAVGTALQIGFGSIGGIIASCSFRVQDAPTFLPGFWITFTLQLIMLFLLAMLSCHFCGINRAVDRGTMMVEGLVGFKYTI